MTGRDLILYILENRLEDKPITELCCMKNLVTIDQAAAKLKVGEETVKVWFVMGLLDGMKIGETIFVSPDSDRLA